jgi:hypothetical protein
LPEKENMKGIFGIVSIGDLAARAHQNDLAGRILAVVWRAADNCDKPRRWRIA